MYGGKQKRQISDSPASSFLVLDSADRSTATSTTGQSLAIPRTQPFNNFKLQKPQNILQGGFNSLKLTEIRFPYALPNVVKGINDSFWITLWRTSTNITTQITVLAGFNTYYTGDALAQAVQNRLNASAVGTVAAGTTWTVTYQEGGIIITAGIVAANEDFTLYPINPTLIGTAPLSTNSLLNVMGFDPLGNWDYLTVNLPGTGDVLYRASTWAPLTYTTYIDFVSNNLTKYQDVTDASTRTNSTGAIILRLYIDDETSKVPENTYNSSGVITSSNFGTAGSFPFVIHRQFMNPKIFKWNSTAAIDSIDIQLYDDRGQLLNVPEEGCPNFQLTFLASEE